ncbi:hypothetical protein LPJ73_000584, partial [Coemansia sp. RSA 2703]
MSQQQTREGNRAGRLVGRTGVGMGQVVEPVAGPKEARAATESTAGALGSVSIATEKAKLDDELMAK